MHPNLVPRRGDADVEFEKYVYERKLWTLIAKALGTKVNSQCPPMMNPAPKNTENSSPEIRFVDNSGYKPTLMPRYVVLGMISEQFGRMIWLNGSTVERFYPHEIPVADIFMKYLGKLRTQAGLSVPIELVEGDRGHGCVESPEMTAFLNGLYPHDFAAARDATDEYGKATKFAVSNTSETMFPTITTPQFAPEEIDPRYSFLYGAYLRYGRPGADSYILADPIKVNLIKEFLASVESDWVEHRYTLKTVPHCHEVSCGASDPLSSLLATARQEIGDAYGRRRMTPQEREFPIPRR